MTTIRAAIGVDLQNDFCEDGSLAVTGGAAVAGRAATLVRNRAGTYTYVVVTRDWHVDPGDHFAFAGTDPDYAGSWPVHCAADTPGAQFHPNFAPVVADGLVDAEFRKGQFAAAYSGFEGGEVDTGTPLGTWLTARGVTDVDVFGLSTDYCVVATALDAAAAGFRVRVLLGYSAGVAAESTAVAIERLRAAGIEVVAAEAVAA